MHADDSCGMAETQNVLPASRAFWLLFSRMAFGYVCFRLQSTEHQKLSLFFDPSSARSAFNLPSLEGWNYILEQSHDYILFFFRESHYYRFRMLSLTWLFCLSSVCKKVNQRREFTEHGGNSISLIL
jgi:hypothetical protein